MEEKEIWDQAFEKLSEKEKKACLKDNDSYTNVKASIKLIQFYRKLSPKYQEKKRKMDLFLEEFYNKRDNKGKNKS